MKYTRLDPEDRRAVFTVGKVIYDQGGADAVLRYADLVVPDAPVSDCDPCDMMTPTVDGVCFVCWSLKE